MTIASYLSPRSSTFGSADARLIERTFALTARRFRSRLLRLVDGLTAGTIDLRRFNLQAGRVIRTEFGITYALGALSVDPFHTLTVRDIRAIDAEVNEQKTFLRAFSRDINRGFLVLNPLTRAGLYLQAMRGMFERGRMESIPAGPYQWRLGIAEHCTPCIQTSLEGPYQRDRFAGLGLPPIPGIPGSGDICQGLTQCACTITLEGGFPLPNEDLQKRVREILVEIIHDTS